MRILGSDKSGGADAELLRGDQRKALIEDISGAIWDGDTAIIAASPIYSKPGIYSWPCGSTDINPLVQPVRKTSAYPDGSDFYRLISVRNGHLYFQHAIDVDSPTLVRDLEASSESVDLKKPILK
jgi:hypothetical protein